MSAGAEAPDDFRRDLRRVRFWIAVFIFGLVLSGLTAFPLQAEVTRFAAILHSTPVRLIADAVGLLGWMETVVAGLTRTNAEYPFLAYGTDWLAFAHIVIALLLLRAKRAPLALCAFSLVLNVDPVRNKWVVQFGLIACTGVIPLALIAGHVRQIPFAWRLVDCSFGVVGAIPLTRCYRLIGRMERCSGRFAPGSD